MTTQDTRATRRAAAVLLAFALICTQVPLLNYLGFEFSAFTAVVASFVAGMLHLSLTGRLARGAEYGRFVVRSLLRCFLLLAIPLGVSAANALLVRNCSFTQGLLYYLLIVPPAVFFSIGLAVLVATLTVRWRRMWLAVLLLGGLLHVVFVTVTRPQIFAFNHLLGYFPGLTYDETLEVGSRLLVFRAETILVGVLMLGISRIIDRLKRRPMFDATPEQPSWSARVGRRWIIATAFAAVAWAAINFGSESLGLSSSAESIERHLGGRIEGPNIVLIYPRSALSPNEARRLLDYHEFLFDELARDLRVSPTRKITSFVYGRARDKGLLIGAAGTNIAKPWLWQLHLNLQDVEAVLKHELTHVMAAEFGFVLFRVGLNPGLIEGLAVAVERTAQGEMLHRLARAAHVRNVAGDLRQIFSIGGFVRASPSVSYPLAGSFCRYLIDRYGLRKFKRLYRSGDFRGVYGKALDSLEADWRSMLTSITPTTDELRKAAYLFDRPSIFAKVCARVIAGMNERTRDFLARGSLDSALELSRRSLELAETPEAVLLHASALSRLRLHQEVLTFAASKLADSTIVSRLLPLRRALGTAAWALGDRERARREFEILRNTRISVAWSEDAALRLHCLAGPSSLLPYFAGELADSLAVGFLSDLQRKKGAREPALSYLLGLAYIRQGSTDSAIAQFARARFDDPVLEFSRHRRIGLAEFAMGRFQKAKAQFWEACNYTWSVALELDLTEWIRRCDWMTEKARSDPHTRALHQLDAPGEKLIFAQNLRLLRSLHTPNTTFKELPHGNDYRSLGAGDPGLARQSYN